MKLYWLLLVAGLAMAAEPPASAPLAQADAAYAQRADLPRAKQSLAAYERAAQADPKSVEAYWKGSRSAWWVGDHATDRAEKMAIFQKGIDLAQEGLKRDSQSVESHYWLAANWGSFGETKGILKSLFLVKPIRREMAEVIRLNDRCDGGGAYRVLGVVDYKVPGFAGGSKKRALEELNKALAIDSRNPFNHYYLAEYYKTLGQEEKAQAELLVLQTLPVEKDLEPELKMLQAKGELLFAKKK